MVAKQFRPINLIAIVLIQLLCFYVGGEGVVAELVAHIILPTILTASAGYFINDFYDQKRDQLNAKKLVQQDLGKEWIYYYLGFNLTALFLSIWDGYPLFFTVLAIQLLLWIYSRVFSNIALLGNTLVSLLSCFTILIYYFSSTVSLHIRNVWVILVAIFLVSMARELIKDIEDYKGDKQDGAQTLPIMTNVPVTHIVADLFIFCNVIFIASWTFYDFYLNDLTATLYGVVISVLGIMIIIVGHVLSRAKRYAVLSKSLKAYMFLGMAILFFLNHV